MQNRGGVSSYSTETALSWEWSSILRVELGVVYIHCAHMSR
jgi:hypothetical protein